MRTELLGTPVDILTMAETLEMARRSMRERVRLQHVALNVAKLVNMRADPLLAQDVADSDLIGIDGMGIIFALRLLRIANAERVAGVDLFQNMMSLCAAEGFRPYLLGATEAVVRRAAAKLTQLHPSLELAGFRNGYFAPDEETEIVQSIRASCADCLFIGIPTPRKERFLAAHRERIGVPFTMGVGGSFDVVAGHVKRAPEAMQKVGLEWLYRVYQEPRRMWWRYAKTNSLFACLLLLAVLGRRNRDITPSPPLPSP